MKNLSHYSRKIVPLLALLTLSNFCAIAQTEAQPQETDSSASNLLPPVDIVEVALQMQDFNAMFLDTIGIFFRRLREFHAATGYKLVVGAHLSDFNAGESGFWGSLMALLFSPTDNAMSIDAGWIVGSNGRLEGRMRQNVSDPSGKFMPESLQLFKDSVEAFHEVNLDSIRNSQAPEYIVALLSVLQAGFASGAKKDTGDFEIQVFEGNRQVEKNAFLLIAALPQPTMPDIRVKPFRQNHAGEEEVEMRLQVAYKRLNSSNEQIRNDSDYYPTGGWQKVKPNEVWDVDFGADIRGGKVTVYCKSADTTISEVFYLRGANPSEQAVRDYLAAHSYNQWFLMKMIRQESGSLIAGGDMRQFNPGAGYGTGWENVVGCPNMGDPQGFGLMQLDNWGTADNPQEASPQQLWDWQANLDGGQEVLQEKLDIVDRQQAEHDEMITRWRRDNDNDTVSDNLEIIRGEGIGTTVATITEGASGRTETFAVNPTGTQRSIHDATLIKLYNGGRRYHQMLIRNSKPYRVLDRAVSPTNNRNYVGELCGKRD